MIVLANHSYSLIKNNNNWDVAKKTFFRIYGKYYNIGVTVVMGRVSLARSPGERLWEDFNCNETELHVQWWMLTLGCVFFCLFVCFSLFLFALHGGNVPHYSCETLKGNAVQPQWTDGTQCYGGTQNGATGFLSTEKGFCHELNTQAQLNTVIIYSRPPQISINTVLFIFLSCVFF